MKKINLLKGMIFFSKRCKTLPVIILCLVSCIDLLAQAPANDNCINATLINVTGNGADTGTFHGIKANLKNATLQPGESISNLQYYAGTDKKSVWYKFSISQHRWVSVMLLQKDTAIAQDAVGLTIYKTKDCLPNLGQLSTEFPVISKFGNSESTCLPPGDYLIQVSSKLSANDSIWVDLVVKHAQNSAYDRPFAPYDYGTITGSQSLLLNVGCLSIENKAEICPAFGKNDTDYNQTAWMVFKTPSYSDLFGIDFASSDYNDSIVFGYNLYEGDARTGPLKLVSGCNIMKRSLINGNYTFPEIKYICSIKTNIEYSIQIFAYKYDVYPLTITISTQGQDTAYSANPLKIPPNYHLGDVSSVVNINDHFACNSRMSLYPCGSDMPKDYVDSLNLYRRPPNNYIKETFDLSTWFTFTLTKPGNVSLWTIITDCRGYPNGSVSEFLFDVFLFNGDVTKDCNTPLLIKWNNPESSQSICLQPGTYSYQVMGASDRHGQYNFVCDNYDLGKHVSTTISFTPEVFEPNSLYDTFPNTDNLGDITSVLQSGGSVTVPTDYFGNRNVRDTIAGRVFVNRILYRQFYISKPMQIEIWQPGIPGFAQNNPGLNFLFSGKASDGPKTLKALPSYLLDSDYYHVVGSGFTIMSGCTALPPGWYSIIDVDQLSNCLTSAAANKMVIQPLKLCPPQFNRPYKASNVNGGIPLDWGPNHGTASAPAYGNTFTFPGACFDCTIDTPLPFNAKPCHDAASKAPRYDRVAYYVFSIKNESFGYINLTDPINYEIQEENSYYGLYYADVRKDSSIMADSSKLLKPCGSLGNFCRLQPGIYTLVVYTNHINTIIPTIYLDKTINSKFDNASGACDLGYIAPDNSIHLSPDDVITCTTGAYASDPEVKTYYGNLISPGNILYGPGKSTVPYPIPDHFNAYNISNNEANLVVLRNLWYTFTATSTGMIYVKLFPAFPTTKRYGQWRVTVYKSSRNGSIPFDTLVAHNIVDSTLAQGLVMTNYSDTAGLDSFAKPDCDTDRYYIVVDYNYMVNGAYLNDQVKVSVRYNGTIYGHDGDFCSNAIPITLNGAGSASGTALVNCHTSGESFGEDGTNLACLDIGQPYKTTWYKVTNTSSQKVDLSFNLENHTNVTSNLIRYRVLYGTCRAMTPGPCVESGYAGFTLDCMSGGVYYIQVVEPVGTTGSITINAIAKPVAHPICKPFDLLKPLANFSSTGGCNSKTVNFINLSSAGDDISYLWDFGNGQTSSAKQPVMIYSNTKQIDTFYVKLVVTDTANKEKDSITLPVYVFRDPVVLTVDKNISVKCGLTVQLHASCNYPNAIFTWTPSVQINNAYIPDPEVIVNHDQKYYVSAKIENCVIVDSVTVHPLRLHININYDYGLCSKNAGILTGDNGYSSYYWSDGTRSYYGQQITVINPGTYTLQATNIAGCDAFDTIIISKSGIFKSHLPPDTVNCSGAPIKISAGLSVGKFLWSDGDTTPSTIVSKSGIYWVEIHNGQCIAHDTTNVQFITKTINIGTDTTICPGSFIILDPKINGASYKWSTGETTRQIAVSKPGIYSVNVNVDGCALIGTINISVSRFPKLNLGSPDTAFCQGFTGLIQINNPVNAGYKWSTGDTTTFITVNKPGAYTLDVHIGKCDTILKKQVNIFPYPTPNLGNDTTICYRFEKVLDAGEGETYHWLPTGETTRWISISHGGIYSVLVTNGAGCTKMDTIIIDTVCEDATLFVPNSFTPNENGVNDLFKAEGNLITDYHLQVYNRWGELLYDTHDINAGWDGSFRKSNCPMDVYIWIVHYSGARGNALVKWGNVTLLR